MTTTAQRDKRITAVDKAIERLNEQSEKAMTVVNRNAATVAELDKKREWLLAMPTDDSTVDRVDIAPQQIFANGQVSSAR